MRHWISACFFFAVFPVRTDVGPNEAQCGFFVIASLTSDKVARSLSNKRQDADASP